MAELMDVGAAARELELDPSRVRALIASGQLDADKVGGRWLVHRDSVVARRREPSPAGRPLASHNAWLLLLLASGEPLPPDVSPVVRWRLVQALRQVGLAGVRRRLGRRAQPAGLWALPGELKALRGADEVVLTGSSAAGSLRLELAAPDAIDAYVRADTYDAAVERHALTPASLAESNVVLRRVPEGAWFLGQRRVAPRAAVAVDLASYPDPRSSRVGRELVARLDEDFRARA